MNEYTLMLVCWSIAVLSLSIGIALIATCTHRTWVKESQALPEPEGEVYDESGSLPHRRDK
jgi:hypothetical protein